MIMKPKRMSFLDSFGCRWSPKWVFSYLVRYFKVDYFALKFLLDSMARLHYLLVQLGAFFLELLLTVLSGLARLLYFCWGGVSLGLLSLHYSHLTEMALRDILICRLQRVCSCQSCQRRVSLVYGRFFSWFYS